MSHRHLQRPQADRIRPLNLPQAVTVGTDDRQNPTWVTTDDSAKRTTDGIQRTKAVAAIVDAWRVDDEWWRDAISRRCFELVLHGGRHVVLYEDLVTGNWFLQRP